jgi:hypothetical protein
LEEGTSTSSYGGAVYSDRTPLQVYDSQFINCLAYQGGAIYQVERTTRIERCEFRGCTRGGAVIMSGSIHYPSDTATVRDCYFEDNHGLGAISGGAFGHETIENNVFIGNSCDEGGGAMTLVSRGTSEVRDNLIWNNHGVGGGGGIYWIHGNAVFERNTFVANTLNGGSGSALFIGRETGDVITVRNNIFWGNTGDEAVYTLPGGVLPTSECNDFFANPDGDVRFYTPGPTDIFVDPQFCNPDAGDFTLTSTSPCLPGNSNGCGQIGAFGMGCGTVSVTPMSWGRIKNQFRNETNPEGR